MISKIERTINTHTEKALSSSPDTPQGPCPRCEEDVESYKLHERRPRDFRCIVDHLVKIIESILLRWDCPVCGKSFTDYPPFAMPYKRYCADNISDISSEYLCDQDGISYRKIVYTIIYEGNEGADQGKSLSHTTVWHWVGYLSTLRQVKHSAVAQLKFYPGTWMPELLLSICPTKYRSLKRKYQLQHAGVLLQAGKLVKKLFKKNIFPRYGTNYC